MDETKARADALDLMTQAPAAYLSTVDERGFPHTRAMLNLRNAGQYPTLAGLYAEHDRDLLVYISTNTSSSKIGQLRANPRAAVYYCLPEQWRGLMLGGEVEFVDDTDLKEKIYQDGWETYFPEGPSDPDFTLLRLQPAVAKYYHSLDTCDFKP